MYCMYKFNVPYYMYQEENKTNAICETLVPSYEDANLIYLIYRVGSG
jgi:hypothetical protein